MRYNHHLYIPLSLEEYEKITRLCAFNDVTRSEFVRANFITERGPENTLSDIGLKEARIERAFKTPTERHPTSPKGRKKILHIRVDDETLNNIDQDALAWRVDRTEAIRQMLGTFEEGEVLTDMKNNILEARKLKTKKTAP